MKPNIVFVLADQLRACSVGYAGEEPVKTPCLDAFCEESVNFRTAVSPLPVCTPYRGSLLTGRTPLSTGLVLNDVQLPLEEVSIAEVLKEAGYDTALIGKWHLNGPDRKAPVPPGPARQGFDFWEAANFEQNYDRSVYFAGDSMEPRVWEGFETEAHINRAIEYMEATDGKPFCLFLWLGPPHHPYRLVPESYLKSYDPETIPARPNCPDPPREDLQGYYAQTTFVDAQFGRLAEALDRLKLSDDTIVIFTSDHGDMHGSHGVYKKQWPWDESIKVPFLIRWPKGFRGGRALDCPLSTIDIMPTLLDLCGTRIPDGVEGNNLAPLLREETREEPRAALLMNPCPFSVGDPRSPDQIPDFQGMRMEYRGVRTHRYTYVRTIDKPWLLYDNREDPYQLHNRIGDPEYAKLAEALEVKMRRLMREIGDEFLPKEAYYQKFGLEVDHRGKVRGIVENPYDRMG